MAILAMVNLNKSKEITPTTTTAHSFWKRNGLNLHHDMKLFYLGILFFHFISDTKEASKLLERATRLLNSDPDSKLSLKDLLVGDSDSDTEQESTSKKAEETSKKELGGKKKAGRPPATSTAASKTSTTSKTSPVSKKPVKQPTPGTRRSSRNRGKNP